MFAHMGASSVADHLPGSIPPPAGRTAGALFAVCALAAILRAWGLGRHELRLDESLSWYCSHYLLDWPEGGPGLWRELTSVPYFFALHLWSRLFGESAVALRSLSTLASLLTVPVLARAARRSLGPRAGLVCALLAAVSPLAIWYAQLARVYAAWALLAALAGLLLFEAAHSNKPSTWAWYGVVLFATLCTHYFTLFWVPATLACLLVCDRRLATLRRWLLTHALVGLAFAPVLVACVRPVASSGSGAWLADYWQGLQPILVVPRSLAAFVPAGEPPIYLHTFTWSLSSLRAAGWGPAATAAKWAGPLVLLASCGGLWRLRALRNTGRHFRPALRTLGFWTLLAVGPLVLAWLYSLTVRPNYLVGRYDMISWPSWMVAVALLVCLGAEGIRPQRAGPVAGTLALILALVAGTYYGGMTRAEPLPSVRERVAAILRHTGRDACMVLADDRWALEYELHRQGFAGSIRSYPPRLDKQIGWRDIQAELADPDRLDTEAEQLAEAVQARLRDGRRAWLLIRSYEGPADPSYRVDGHLFKALKEANLAVGIVDEPLGLARLMPER